MPKTRPKLLKPDCRQCDGQCCRYFAVQIDAPVRRKNIDHIRWFLAHRKIAIFADKKDWFIQVWNNCRHLTKAYRCSIYEERPRICREYGGDISKEDCVDSPNAHDLYFTKPGEFERWLLNRDKRQAVHRS
ncbi:MAG: YkgJ family cysteine cluster protein [Fibrobacterota bacterium]